MEQQDLYEQTPEQLSEKSSKFMTYLKSVLSGNILTGDEFKKAYGPIIKILIVVLIYISNSYAMYQRYRTQDKLTKQIKELRFKSVTLSSQVMNSTRQSEIVKELKKRGIELHSSRTPHKLLED